MKKLFTCAIFVGLTACADVSAPVMALNMAKPSDWTDEQKQFVASSPDASLCTAYRRDLSYEGRFTPEDLSVLDGELKRRGFSNRDIELIRTRNQLFGTDQSYRGLLCSLGAIKDVNKSFIAGQHSWQVVTFGSSFIYLEGNGQESGMRVTGWN